MIFDGRKEENLEFSNFTVTSHQGPSNDFTEIFQILYFDHKYAKKYNSKI